MIVEEKSIKFEAINSQIQIIGGSIYPKEESWSPLCPHCEKKFKIRLVWDQDACEFQLIISKGNDAKLGEVKNQ